MQKQQQDTLTAVLVHAAWADGSSWNKVTIELQRRGFHVVAAQLPVTSFKRLRHPAHELKDRLLVYFRVLRDQGVADLESLSPTILYKHLSVSSGGRLRAKSARSERRLEPWVIRMLRVS
jgi:hypothetical protein